MKAVILQKIGGLCVQQLLSHCVMVALQILVLSVEVRIPVGQHKKRSPEIIFLDFFSY